MSELLPRPELSHTLPQGVSQDQCIAMWIDLVDTTDAVLLAGLRRTVGADGDLRAAYRRWQDDYRVEHDKITKRVMKALRQLKD